MNFSPDFIDSLLEDNIVNVIEKSKDIEQLRNNIPLDAYLELAWYNSEIPQFLEIRTFKEISDIFSDVFKRGNIREKRIVIEAIFRFLNVYHRTYDNIQCMKNLCIYLFDESINSFNIKLMDILLKQNVDFQVGISSIDPVDDQVLYFRDFMNDTLAIECPIEEIPRYLDMIVSSPNVNIRDEIFNDIFRFIFKLGGYETKRKLITYLFINGLIMAKENMHTGYPLEFPIIFTNSIPKEKILYMEILGDTNSQILDDALNDIFY